MIVCIVPSRVCYCLTPRLGPHVGFKETRLESVSKLFESYNVRMTHSLHGDRKMLSNYNFIQNRNHMQGIRLQYIIVLFL